MYVLPYIIFEFSKLLGQFLNISKKRIIANSNKTVFPDPVGDDTTTDSSKNINLIEITCSNEQIALHLVGFILSYHMY